MILSLSPLNLLTLHIWEGIYMCVWKAINQGIPLMVSNELYVQMSA